MNNDFNNIWEQVERQALQQRLKREFQHWQRKQRAHRTTLASVALLIAVASGIALSTHHSPLPTYDSVVCNRSTFPASHWAEEAGRILTIQTI